MPADSSSRLPIERQRLDNGLEIVLQPDRTLPLVAVNLWYHVGSKNEHPGRTGLAHLFEHMLFQGSANVDANDHFRLVQQAGGTANGSTRFDRTNYYETLPTHHLDLALWLESDRMGFLLPALDREKLENQRQVVMNERRERIDNQPYGRAFERLHELLYPQDHPYSWPVIGYMDDIAAATLDDVADFFSTHYVPNNAVLTLVGDFEPTDALARIDTYFGAIPAGEPIPRAVAPATSVPTSRHEVMEDAVELGRVYLASTVPGIGHQDWYGADPLTTALAAGKSSPLYADLVYDRQLATDVSAFVLPTELAATFAVVATARPEVDVRRLEEALGEHLETAAREGPADRDLERARNKVVTAWTDQFQRLDDRADLLSMFATYFDDPGRIEREAEIYARIETAELVELTRQYLGPERRVTLNVVPAGRS